MKQLRLLSIALVLAGLALAPSIPAAGRSEEDAFASATQPFAFGNYSLADTELGAFIRAFPNSERRPQVLLFQAQARFNLTNYSGAIELLTNSLASAGDLSGEYLLWLGRSWLGASNFVEAARSFTRVQQVSSAPELMRLASIGEGRARVLQGDFAGAVELLGAADGPLQSGLREQPEAEPMIRGQLLYAEALLKLRRFPDLDRALEPLSNVKLSPDLDWHRLWLIASGQREEGDLPNALATVSNLVTVARTAGRPSLTAESTSLLGDVLRQLGRANDAIAAYRLNLDTNAPVSARQQALVNLINLQLQGDRFAEATNELQNYTAQYPQESNIWSFVLADLQLREYARQFPGTNMALLVQAQATLTRISAAFTDSELQGRAQLLLGWCLWEQGNFEESGKAFLAAVEKLSPSTDQMLARFKLADLQLKRGDATNAAAAYRQLASDLRKQPEAQRLIEPLLYQWLRASVQIKDAAGARVAMERLLRDYPRGENTGNGLRSLGRFEPVVARELYESFAASFPESPLLPEVELLIAHSYEREGDWSRALKQYDEWLANFGGNTNQPSAEYNRALCAWRAGNSSEAISAFTNFGAVYPMHPLTPLALQRVAEEYLGARQFVDAEKIYVNIFQSTNWPVSEVTLSAGFGAARSAFARYAYGTARGYLTNVVNLLSMVSNAPPELTAKAYLLLGDTILELYLEDQNRTESLWSDAMTAFQVVGERFKTNQLAARAWGRIGAAHLQHQNRDTNFLAKAIGAWQQIIELEVAAVDLRSQAEFAIGRALEIRAAQLSGLEQEAQLKEAQDRYENVVYWNLRERETPDPFWYCQAGLAAAHLAQQRGNPRYAMNLYMELIRQFPALRAEIDPLLEIAKARSASTGN